MLEDLLTALKYTTIQVGFTLAVALFVLGFVLDNALILIPLALVCFLVARDLRDTLLGEEIKRAWDGDENDE